METRYIGIDPGLEGGIAVIEGKAITLIPMPATEQDIWRHLSYLAIGNVVGMIEKIPTAIFGIDKSSMSKLYGSYSGLRMALTAAEIPFEEETAKIWQKALGISPKNRNGETQYKWKQRLKRHSQQLFPKEDIEDSTADALLIAEYARRKHTGKLLWSK